MTLPPLQKLAEAAGVATHWTDAFGQPQQVQTDSLLAILTSLRLPAGTDTLCLETLEAMQGDARTRPLPPVSTAWAGQPLTLPPRLALHTGIAEGTAYQIRLENGGVADGRMVRGADGTLQLAPLQVPGYHVFECAGTQNMLAVAPRQSFGVGDALKRAGKRESERLWGLSAQLYSLRGPQDAGLADFTALERLATRAAAHGAAALATSPVHAMFSADPQRFSPYGPSSRLFINVLHIDPARAFGSDALRAALADLPDAAQRAHALEAHALVDWPAAGSFRLTVLRKLFDQSGWGQAVQAGQAPGRRAFMDFCTRGGQALQDHATFEALDAWLRTQHPHSPSDWRRWPAQFHDPRSAAVQAFAAAHAQELRFHQFLQWLADTGCGSVQSAARAAGMPIGIIADLAVGADPGGSQAWGLQTAMLEGLGVGAPPDLLGPHGQNWGLGAFSPLALAADGFAPWIAMLRANMRHAGGIRIDHVLGLARLWLVPEGRPASSGAYVRYPLDDLLRLTALESWRHEAIVIGEDMGTVPEGLSDRLASAGVLGIRALWFQRDGPQFLSPGEWPADAMACTSTHDLATIAGWWTGRDIQWRDQLALLPPDSTAQTQDEARARDRHELWAALQQSGCAEAAGMPDAPPVDEVLMFIASTPSPLVMVPLEDALAVVEQPNLPGTVNTHPNWRQRLPREADTLLDTPDVARRLARMSVAREAGPPNEASPS